MTLADVARSKIHYKILSFFHENQASLDSPKGIATWIREERTPVKKALEDLVKMEILVAHRSSSMTGYSYTTDQKLIKQIQRLLEKKR